MDEININLIQLLKLNLNVNEYLTLLKLKYLSEDISIPFSATESIIQSLIDKGFINTSNNEIQFTSKGLNVFKKAGIVISEKDFENLYNLYPSKTPSGRKLRSSAKVSDRFTRDFEVCYKKYKNIIKTIDEHEDVIQCTKNLIYDYKRRNSMEFMQNFETFLNQRSWEKYADTDYMEIYGENIEKL